MLDSFRSSILFFRSHRGAVSLLTVTLSIVFFSCLMLHSLSRVAFLNTDTSKEYSSMYEINFQPANKEMTQKLIDATYHSDSHIEDLNIHGEVELISRDGMTTAHPLISFDNVQSTPIEIYRGSTTLAEGDVLIDEWIYSDLIDTDNDTITMANGDSRHISGVVFIPGTLDYIGVIVERDSFFSMTDSSTSLQVLFSDPLTKEAEEKWIDDVKRYVSITSLTFPSENLQAIENESSLQTLLSRVLIVVILLCTMRLMTYLFLLRKQEFSVIRMLGANHTRITAYVFAMIIEITGISVLISMIGYGILVRSRLTEKILPILSPELIMSDVVFFLSATLMIGLALFLLDSKLDVTRMNEEV